jgi:hypothetical protein
MIYIRFTISCAFTKLGYMLRSASPGSMASDRLRVTPSRSIPEILPQDGWVGRAKYLGSGDCFGSVDSIANAVLP